MSSAIIFSHPLKPNKTSSNTPLSLYHISSHPQKTHKSTCLPKLPRFEHTRKKIVVMTTSYRGPKEHGTKHVLEEKSKTSDLIALVTVKFKKADIFKEIIRRSVSAVTQHKEGVILQVVSKEVDPETLKPKVNKEAILHWSTSSEAEAEYHTYKVNLEIDSSFGEIGAVYVSNRYQDEFYLKSISVQGSVNFACRSWIQPAKINSETKRVFFYDKAHLPFQTPKGLIELRQRELTDLRGDGEGLRLPSDRIYDYDVYNDLGNPDKGVDFVRPTLGGENNPYPRRCRSGRPPTSTDIHAETPPTSSLPSYVPRDEEYEDRKKEFMSQGRTKAILRNIIPVVIDKIFGDKNFYVAVDADPQQQSKSTMKIVSLDKHMKNPIFHILSKLQEMLERVAKVDPPKYISKDVMWGMPDDEFGRRVLAGVNPVSIEKLKVFPPVSKLDPSIYGPQESALKDEHILGFLEGMSVQQALDEDKLFILDFHDVYLPIVDGINAIEGRKAYATRTIFFLSPLGTLKPIAIELSLPLAEETTTSKHVLTPPTNGTTDWLWLLAKEHVCANDAAVHTLINHWLRIHACMEPFFIAAHRNLSVMHPIFKLLHPHMRYLMKTNAYSREVLVNAGAFIESFNSPAKYCMQFSGYAYRDWWRFDLEGLPDDLIRRGMAVRDSTHPHGIKLAIDDYPYAQDALLIWSAIENLVIKYVNHYYPEPTHVQNDTELQAWYKESINSGHADLRSAPWWPSLSTQKDLVKILTTIIWTVTGEHAVVNFGQYSYGAYTPVRPPFMRKLLPSDRDLDVFTAYFLSSVPSLTQAANYAAVLDAGSGHSPDEEYIGQRKDLVSWSSEPEILEAFDEFTSDMGRIETEIGRRNSDPRLGNRCGAGVYPFELLIPSSGPGTTSRGVPNSVTA